MSSGRAFPRRGSAAASQELLGQRLQELAPVREPLVLISQAQRSGGTLLLRLLDGHPRCNVVPFQLRGIDEAAKRGMIDPGEAWQVLHDPKLAERYQYGHRQRKHDVLRDDESFPFELPPDLQRAIYDHCVARLESPLTRDLFDCYFASYFNAWLNYRNLRTGKKRWVVGFEPGVARSIRRRTAVRDVYPDGRILTIVRDPWSWFASARRWEPRWRDRERALDHWIASGKGVLKWRKLARRSIRMVRFENLLTRTEETMRLLARWLKIEFVPGMLEPTFNGSPIRANTSFADVSTEISTRPLERSRHEISVEDRAFIEERAGELYRRLVHNADLHWEALGGS